MAGTAINLDLLKQFGRELLEKLRKGELQYDKISVDTLSVDTVIDGKGANAFLKNIYADAIQAGDAAFNTAIINQLKADIGEFESLSAEGITAGAITAAFLKATTSEFGDLYAQNATFGTLLAEKATISDLNAEKARIDTLSTGLTTANELIAGKADITSLTAAEARIGSLETDNVTINGKLTAQDADIKNIKSNYVTTAVLQAGYLTAEKIEADYAKIDDLEAVDGKFDNLSATYAKLDFSNVGQESVDTLFVKSSILTDAAIVNGKITGNLDATNIRVTNLTAANIQVGTINGVPISGNLDSYLSAINTNIDNKIDATEAGNIVDNKLNPAVENLQNQIDGAIETFTGPAVPSLTNYPTKDWGTDNYSKHVGDLYIVDATNTTNAGFLYRFMYDNGSKKYKWVYVPDTELTKALSDLNALEDTVASNKTDIEGKLAGVEATVSTKADGSTITTLSNNLSDYKETVDGYVSRTEAVEKSVASKADGTTVTSLTNRVAANETSISGLNSKYSSMETTIASKADGSTVTSLSKQVSSFSTDLSGFKTTVSNTYQTKSDMSNYATTSYVGSEISSSASNIKQEVKQTYVAVADTKNLGVNLLSDTREFGTKNTTGNYLNTVSSYTSAPSSELYKNFRTRTYKRTINNTNGTGTTTSIVCQYLFYGYKPEGVYSFSFYAKGNCSGLVAYFYSGGVDCDYCYLNGVEASRAENGHIDIAFNETEFKRFEIKWILKSSGQTTTAPKQILLRQVTVAGKTNTVDIEFYGLKFEEGPVCTEWSESPADLRESAVSMAASIEVNAKSITSKVSADGVISAINQTSESATISASKINLTGYLTINSATNNNLLKDTNASSMAAVEGPGHRYLSDTDNADYISGSFFQLTDSPSAYCTYGYRIAASGKKDIKRALCFYGDSSSGESYLNLKVGQRYKISCFARAAYNNPYLHFQVGANAYATKKCDVTSSWKKYEYILTITQNLVNPNTGIGTRVYFGMYTRTTGNEILEICGFSVEALDEDYVGATDLSTSGSTVINGGNISTGTIDASKATITNINASNITTGTLSAERLNVGFGINLLENYDTLENIYYNSSTDQNIYYSKNVAVNVVDYMPYIVPKSLYLVKNNTDGYIYLGVASTNYACVPILLDTDYIISFYAKATVETTRSMNLQLYVAGRAEIGTSSVAIVRLGEYKVSTSWQRFHASIKYNSSNTNEAKVKYISLRFDNECVNDGDGIYINAIMVERAYGGRTEPSPFSRAGSTLIDGGHVMTGTITASSIATGTITSNEINASSIRTAILTANSVKAANIDVNDLFANSAFITKLNANTLDVSSAGSSNLLLTSRNFEQNKNWTFAYTPYCTLMGDSVKFKMDYEPGTTADSWYSANGVLNIDYIDYVKTGVNRPLMISIDFRSPDWNGIKSYQGTSIWPIWGIAEARVTENGDTLSITRRRFKTMNITNKLVSVDGDTDVSKYTKDYLNSLNIVNSDGSVTPTWHRFVLGPFTLALSTLTSGTANTDANGFILQIYSEKFGEFEFRRPQVEYGKAATEYHPSSNDYDSDIRYSFKVNSDGLKYIQDALIMSEDGKESSVLKSLQSDLNAFSSDLASVEYTLVPKSIATSSDFNKYYIKTDKTYSKATGSFNASTQYYIKTSEASSSLLQTANEFNVAMAAGGKIANLQMTVDDLTTKFTGIDGITTWLKASTAGLTIGKSDSKTSTVYSNDGFAIKVNNVTTGLVRSDGIKTIAITIGDMTNNQYDWKISTSGNYLFIGKG